MAHAPAAAPRPPGPRWQVPLLVGFCFGVGYGITQRLLALQLPSLVRLGQGFEVRSFPGTSLESLRLRFGADSQEVRGNLDLLELEQPGQGKAPEAGTDPADVLPDSGPDQGPPGQRPAGPALQPSAQTPPALQLPPPTVPAPVPQPDLPQSSPDAGL